MKNKIKEYLKDNFKFLIICVVLFFIMLIEFPYYIEAPGGIVNIQNRIKIDSKYQSKGSFNLAYVSEYKATLPTMLFSVFNKNWKIIKKKDIVIDNESIKDYELRDRLLLKEAYSNAIYVGYTKALKEINVLNEEIYVSYLFEDALTDLVVGDKIVEIDHKKINSKEDIESILNNHQIGDEIEIKVIQKNKEQLKKATLIEYKGKPIIGISVVKIKEVDTEPHIEINYKDRESGPSGGLMLSLAIYNDLVEEDITNGLTIVGTGTIDENGNVGSIGGVEYKLSSAVKKKADIFIVPNGDNYKDAIKCKNKNHYNIEIIGVSSFDEALEELKKRI